MSIKADELISARKIIDLLIDVQINEERSEFDKGIYSEELKSLWVVEDILSTAEEYIFDDVETEIEYINKVNRSIYDN